MGDLRIEFAGLCIAAHKAGQPRMRVILPHTRSFGGPRHSAVLLTEDTPGLSGTPHFTVAPPASGLSHETEFAGWHLRGQVRIMGDLPKFKAPDTRKAVARANPSQVTSVSYLLPLHRLAGTNKLKDEAFAPISASVEIDAGVFRPLAVDAAGFEVTAESKGDTGRLATVFKGPAVERGLLLLANVSRVQLSFDGQDGSREVVALTLDAADTRTLVISNLSSAQNQPHLSAYFECLAGDPPRDMTISSTAAAGAAGVGRDWPFRPEECMCAWLAL